MNTVLMYYSVHFLINIWGAVVFLFAGFGFIDAWRIDKKKRSLLIRALGFFFIAVGFAVGAGITSVPWVLLARQITTILGLIFVAASLLSEPLSFNFMTHENAKFIFLPAVSIALYPLSIVLFLLCAVIYWRKAVESSEKYRKIVALGFLVLGLSDVAGYLSSRLSGTFNPFLFKLTSLYGVFWFTEHFLEFAGIALMALFIWELVRFRIRSQIIIGVVTAVFIFFIMIFVMFIYLLLNSFEGNVHSHLQENNSVLQYLLQTQQDKIIAQGEVIARDAAIQNALLNGDQKALNTEAQDFFVKEKASTLVIATSSGEILVRVENKEKVGQKLASDYIIKQALQGKATATFTYYQNVPVSQLTVEAAVPIIFPRNGNEVSGVVVLGFPIDVALVDSVKKASGLDVTVFGMDQRVATTFFAEDGVTRAIGTLETNPNVLQKVLKDGQEVFVKENILSKPFYGSYLPIKSADGKIVGMLFVGESQELLINMSQRSIGLTVLGSIGLLAISIIPVYYFARHIEKSWNG